MMADIPPKARSPKRKFHWWRVVLVVSLALNLAIIGLIAGAVAGRDHRPGAPSEYASRDFGYAPFIGAFEPGDRRALGRDFRQDMPDRSVLRQRRAERFEDILDALRADPYDPDALAAALRAQREDLAQGQAIGEALLSRRINAMETAERRNYADRLDQAVNRPQRHFGPDHERAERDGRRDD